METRFHGRGSRSAALLGGARPEQAFQSIGLTAKSAAPPRRLAPLVAPHWLQRGAKGGPGRSAAWTNVAFIASGVATGLAAGKLCAAAETFAPFLRLSFVATSAGLLGLVLVCACRAPHSNYECPPRVGIFFQYREFA